MHSKNLRHPRTISTVVEDEIYKEFAEILPRHKTVAEAIRDYMSSVVDESKKAEDSENPLPILSLQVKGSQQQITLDTYFPHWMTDWENYELQNKIQDSLDPEQKRQALIILNKATQRWKGRM